MTPARTSRRPSTASPSTRRAEPVPAKKPEEPAREMCPALALRASRRGELLDEEGLRLLPHLGGLAPVDAHGPGLATSFDRSRQCGLDLGVERDLSAGPLGQLRLHIRAEQVIDQLPRP